MIFFTLCYFFEVMLINAYADFGCATDSHGRLLSITPLLSRAMPK